MNADQIVKVAAFQASAIKQDGSLTPFYTLSELYAWLNDANFELEKEIRSIFDDYFVRVMSSTDTTPQKILGITYTPTSLQIPAATSRISLPPDFETMRRIRCITAGYEYMDFEHRDMGNRSFVEYHQVPPDFTVPPGGRHFYDIIAERTLFIVPQLTSPIDIEIIYVARTKPLVRYATGTMSVADGTAAVTGVGTTWSSGTPFDSTYLDMMIGVTAPTAITNVDVSWNYDGVTRNRVASITNDTTITLASNKVGVANAGTAYILSSVPVLPPEHHAALADYVTAQMFAKAQKDSQFDRYMGKFQKRLGNILNSVNIRQPDCEFAEEYSTWGT
jgi:hypothetical protein